MSAHTTLASILMETSVEALLATCLKTAHAVSSSTSLGCYTRFVYIITSKLFITALFSLETLSWTHGSQTEGTTNILAFITVQGIWVASVLLTARI